MASRTDLGTLGEQHLERVYRLFEGKAKSFRWTLFGLIGLALVFFTLIAFPYITLQDEGVRIGEELRGLADEIADAEADRNQLAAAARHLGDLRQKVDLERRRMTDFAWWQALERGAAEQGQKVGQLKENFRSHPELAAWAAGEVLRPDPSDWFFHGHPDLRDGARDPCFWLDDVRWQRCRADSEITAFHERKQAGSAPSGSQRGERGGGRRERAPRGRPRRARGLGA